MSTIYPGVDWQRVEPAAVSLDAAKLQQAKAWLADHVNEGKYRVAGCHCSRPSRNISK
jgi:hypothetical protein